MLALLGAIVACGSPKPAKLEPIYRYINLTDGSTVRLGERFDRTDVAKAINDTTYHFRPGTFGGGGTVAITAYTDSLGVLRTLDFAYDGTESFRTKVHDYTASLGAPRDSSATPADGAVVIWEDSLTRFELYYAPGYLGHLWSRLEDRSDWAVVLAVEMEGELLRDRS